MVRADAPQFASAEEAVKWLDGKVVATPKGSCADRFLRQVMDKTGVKPKEVLNQSIEVITTNFRVKKIDGAVLWEPSVSRIGDFVGEGVAREIATGHTYGIPDGGFIAMREDFIKKHPAIAKAWLKAELEAQKFILDPNNWEEVGKMVQGQTEGISQRMAWFSLFGRVPDARGGSPIRDTKPFVFSDAIRSHLTETYAFLFHAKVIDVEKAPEGAIDDGLAREVIKEGVIAVPLGQINPLDVSKAPK
jgi:NitT/TauT family transport system substrate-binding protein